MAKVCSLCNKEYKGATCPTCTETGVDVKKVLESEKAQMEKNEAASVPTAFLVDLVSNRKIPITTPRCRVGRDDLNDIVISGDQSISRFHFIITYENGQYQVQDAKSRHGTFLNGNQIGGPEPINDGDVLKIGVSLFWFVIESQAGQEKDEPLPPVDVAKAAASAEELSMKKGGDYNYAAETELSATQEISIISPEALAQFGLTQKGAEEFEPPEPNKEDESKSDSKDDDKAESEKVEAEKADEGKTDEAKAEEGKSDDGKADDYKSDDGKSDDAKADDKADDDKSDDAKSDSDKEAEAKNGKSDEAEPVESKKDEEESSKSDADKDDKDDKESDKPESAKEAEEEKKDDDREDGKSDDKQSSDEEEKPAEPTGEDDADAKKDDPIEVAVKDLLEPLRDEIEASREMIRDALKKGDLKAEEKEEDKEDDKEAAEEPASKSDEKADEKDEEREEEESKPEAKSDDEDEDEPESSTKKDKSPDEKSQEAETLEKIAEIIDDSSKSDMAEKGDERAGIQAERIETELASDHDKATNGLDEDMTTVTQMGPTNVPDWCKKYFSDELKHLNKELDTLNDQIKQYQDKIRKIEGQAALTKGIRNTLLTAEGDDLIEACKKVLGLAGWKVTQSEEDKHEFLLEHEDEKVLIARVISIKGSAERSHLGQLSISQTRFWCEKGIEPKGVLIVGKISDKSPKERGEDTNEEVIEYANMKNVCIMNTLQLLALYRDIALKDGKSSELRSSIHDSKGWLKGFDIEPGDEIIDDESGEATKGKSLSSLLSA